MNNDRRAALQSIGPELTQLKELSERIHGLIEEQRDEEQSYLDEMPEAFKSGDRGNAAEAAVAALDEALSELDQIDTTGIISAIEEAAERSIDARAKEAKASKKVNREDRLPPWAKTMVQNLRDRIQSLENKAQVDFPEPSGALDEVTCEDYGHPAHERVIPFKRLGFPGLELVVEVDNHRRVLNLRANGFGGSIHVIPCSGNEVAIFAGDWENTTKKK